MVTVGSSTQVLTAGMPYAIPRWVSRIIAGVSARALE